MFICAAPTIPESDQGHSGSVLAFIQTVDPPDDRMERAMGLLSR